MGADHRLFLEATLPHLDVVYQITRQTAVDGQDPEDLVQEPYPRAYASFGSFRSGNRRGRVGGPGQGRGRQRRLTAAGGPPAPLTALAAARGVTEDAIELAALAQPFASVVLSGAVTRAQLDQNLAALTVGQVPALSLAEAPDAYWAERAARPRH